MNAPDGNQISFIGTWGLYPWFHEHGLDYIHPADASVVREHHPYGRVFECTGTDGDFILLQCHDKEHDFSFRARPSLFKPIPQPPAKVADRVMVFSGGDCKTAQIVALSWHSNKGEYMFFLAIDGKRKSRRYWLSDFINRVE